MAYRWGEYSVDLPQDNQRTEERLSSLGRLYVEIEAAVPQEGSQARVIACELMDFSTNGVRVRLPEKIPQGAILPVLLDFPGHERRYTLMAEVRWVRLDDENDQHIAGFMLFESDGTAIVDWKETVARWLA